MPRTPITVHCSEECWRLLRDPDRFPSTVALSAKVRDLLTEAQEIEVAMPDFTIRYAVDLPRKHLDELVEYVGATLRALQPSHPQRAVLERCLNELNEGIRRSRKA